MTLQLITRLRNFNSYQKERFPLVVLILSLIPAVLSSGAIVALQFSLVQVLFALIASVAYLLHIRIIDEHRDFGHDSEHHASRPVQSGVITERELRSIDIVAVGILMAIAATTGSTALLVVFFMLGYSYIAGKEFFVGERIRRYFFTYNALNLVQMLLMQLFVYTIFAPLISIDSLIVAHFVFTSLGTVIFEFVRKIKVPGYDGTGKDTYTWYMGFNTALAMYIVLLLANVVSFGVIKILLLVEQGTWFVFATLLVAGALLFAIVHWTKKMHKTDVAMQLSFLIMYGYFNLAIFYFRLYA